MPLNHLSELSQVLQDGITTHRLTGLREAVFEAAEPCILLYQAENDKAEAAPVGATRFGGLLDLPASVVWPADLDKKLPFIARVDLVALPRLEGCPLPGAGRLSFFGAADSNSLVAAVLSQGDRDALQRRSVREQEIKPTRVDDRVYDSVPILEARLAISLTPGRMSKVPGLPGEYNADIP